MTPMCRNPMLGATFALVASVAQAQPLDCMIQPHQVVQVGSATPGVIENIAVERGDIVERGQPIVQLKAEVERASLALARTRLAQEGELSAAKSAQAYAQRELNRASELYEQKFISHNFLDKQRTEAQVAEGRADQAREKRALAAREVDVAEAQLALRTIRAPISGVVVERYLSHGEHVDEKPILRIASVDPLRVDVLVPAVAFGQVALGQKVTVVPELLNRDERVAVVKGVDRVIDAASNTFRVRLELANPDGRLPAGLRCKADLGLDLRVASGASADPRRAPIVGAESTAARSTR